MLLNMLRDIVAASVRQFGPLPRMNKAMRSFNRLMLRLGAQPVVNVRMKDGFRMRVDLRTRTQVGAYYSGQYDPLILGLLLSLLDKDALFLDVGANIGFYAVTVAHHIRRTGGTGRVICFEPLRSNYMRLLENLELNGLGHLCTALDLGLSSLKEERDITLREDFQTGSNTGNASIATSEEFDRGFAMTSVCLNRLDDIWPGLARSTERIDLVKMDIEGHEDHCLEGAVATFRAHRPIILMEVNKPYYAARGVRMDERILPFLPEKYSIHRNSDGCWRRLRSLEECSRVDNVFIVPEERASLLFQR